MGKVRNGKIRYYPEKTRNIWQRVIGHRRTGGFECRPSRLELGNKSRLFADFVSRNVVYVGMPFDRDGNDAVGVNGMIAAFADESEPILFKLANEVFAFD